MLENFIDIAPIDYGEMIKFSDVMNYSSLSFKILCIMQIYI